MKFIYFIMPVMLLLSIHADAGMSKVINATSPENIKLVKIFYTGAITENKIISLANVIDEIEQKYKSTQLIYLYINSSGGDMDSGKIGLKLVKDSPIPITTVNLSSVESSATMIFCGAKNRLIMDDTTFLLHAPKLGHSLNNSSEVNIDQAVERLKIYRDMFKKTYRQCTNLTDAQIDKITYSEDAHEILNNKEALAIGLATGETEKIERTDAAYYIYDGNSK
ncbi:hypothetical protein GCM10011328_29220 [Hafnia psychrotolerans]|uniref:ATP-dependent Clp protease proteolytic subunit n=2 Tax=Hafnia psychrotolerans TaxID=1477018 RepID=A0ABQ1GWR0_9GAMM|nr:hypothetical protein GCM10011328_29220 [Hafnia psychrotolerans]